MKGLFRRSALASALTLACEFASTAQQTAKHPITFDDMIKMHRVAEPNVPSIYRLQRVTSPKFAVIRGA